MRSRVQSVRGECCSYTIGEKVTDVSSSSIMFKCVHKACTCAGSLGMDTTEGNTRWSNSVPLF